MYVCMYLCVRLYTVKYAHLTMYLSKLHYTVPSAAPSAVKATVVNSTAINVQWSTVPCVHQNGHIKGYSVRYGKRGTDEGERTLSYTVEAPNITGLARDTTYTFEVAGVTSAGIGVYSDLLTIKTPANGKKS